MGVIRRNNAEGGANAVAITALNTGGGRNGHGFDTVVGNASHTFSSTVPIEGALNYTYASNSGASYVEWNIGILEHWGSCFFRWFTTTTGDMDFVQALGAADAQAAVLRYNTNTKKITVGGQGAGTATSTGVFTQGTWCRIDWHFKMHATAGVAEARCYFDLVGAPNTFETVTETSAATLGTMAKLRIGMCNTPVDSTWSIRYDDLIIEDRNWVDRRPHPTSRAGRVLSA